MEKISYTVDYFDSFKMRNRYNEPCKIIEFRNDDMVYVEVSYPIKKRIVVPCDCLTEYTEEIK